MRNAFVAILLITSACREQRPPEPTSEQSEQLNEAENMLDALATNEEGPADRSTGPSNSSN